MLGQVWNLVYQPLLWLLVELYKLFGNFGLAILGLTALTRGALMPVSISSLGAAKKMSKLKPKLDELSKKHKKDKQRLASEQMKLYREHGVNPAGGCLPMILQFVILIALYQVFIHFLRGGKIDGVEVNMSFMWLNLAKPDPFFILPLLAGASQFFVSFLMMSKEQRKEVFRFGGGEDKPMKEEMGAAMQKQMALFMPLMTVFIAWRLPSGLALYWVATSLFSLGQQIYVNKKHRG